MTVLRTGRSRTLSRFSDSEPTRGFLIPIFFGGGGLFDTIPSIFRAFNSISPLFFVFNTIPALLASSIS